jgi:hypothetical protein
MLTIFGSLVSALILFLSNFEGGVWDGFQNFVKIRNTAINRGITMIKGKETLLRWGTNWISFAPLWITRGALKAGFEMP